MGTGSMDQEWHHSVNRSNTYRVGIDMRCGSGAEPVAMAVNMDGPRALEGRRFDRLPLSRAIGKRADRGVDIWEGP
jgi:hypothetical protein